MFVLSQNGEYLVNIANVSHLAITNHNAIIAKPIDGIGICLGQYGSREEAKGVIQDFISNTVPVNEYYRMRQQKGE